MGSPIRKSADQCLLTAPRSLSQPATSFIASECQGIHQMPFFYLMCYQTTEDVKRNKNNLEDYSHFLNASLLSYLTHTVDIELSLQKSNSLDDLKNTSTL